jgi:hypothetical protein
VSRNQYEALVSERRCGLKLLDLDRHNGEKIRSCLRASIGRGVEIGGSHIVDHAITSMNRVSKDGPARVRYMKA